MIEEGRRSSTIAWTGAGTSAVDDNLIEETTIAGEEGGAGETVQLNPSLTLRDDSQLVGSRKVWELQWVAAQYCSDRLHMLAPTNPGACALLPETTL